MQKNRLEAFSDGVIAILITIMVLELNIPHEHTLEALAGVYPVFLSYVMSFVYLAIYWNNHHHMLHTCNKVTGSILWANLHLLFWLSLVPFVTGWMGENHFAGSTTAVYGMILLMAAIAYYMLQQRIIAIQGPDSVLKKAIRNDVKGKASPVLYLVAIAVPGIQHFFEVGNFQPPFTGMHPLRFRSHSIMYENQANGGIVTIKRALKYHHKSPLERGLGVCLEINKRYFKALYELSVISKKIREPSFILLV